MDHEHIMNQRTAATRAVVAAVDDSGLVQTVDVQSHGGVLRGGAEVHTPFGFASVPPANGAVTVLIANGGDPSDMVALPPSCPAARLGGLAPGEVAIHAADGTRVHIQQGGIVTILAASAVRITAQNCTLTCAGGVTIDGPVSVSGNLNLSGNVSVTGNITATGSITAHA